jgi:hypothetical protein
MNPYSVYDYLTFILPGSTVIFVAIYGWYGWPWGDPGASLLVGLVAAGFIAGNALAAAANWLEPALLGAMPGSLPNGLWGQFALGDRYVDGKDEIEIVFVTRYGGSFEQAYRMAQIELRDKGKGDVLDRINQQIGFYRGMAVAWLACIILEAVYGAAWHTHLLVGLWIPLFVVMAVLFAYRFRRFWRWYGDYVIRNVLVLAKSESAS